MCQDPKKIRELGAVGAVGAKILDHEGYCILYFHFSPGILGIFDPVVGTMSYDPRDIGFQK